MKPTEPGGLLTHMPLPYAVRVRTVVTEDSTPVITERTVMAYSVMEAAMQLSLEAGASGVNDAKSSIESIQPDVAAYSAIFYSELQAALARR